MKKRKIRQISLILAVTMIFAACDKELDYDTKGDTDTAETSDFIPDDNEPSFNDLQGAVIYPYADIEEHFPRVLVDGATANLEQSAVYDGISLTLDDSSSKLIVDKMYDYPDEYNEIVNILFEDGYAASFSQIKIEIDAENITDENHAVFTLAESALKVNPDIKFELLLKNTGEIKREDFETYENHVNSIIKSAYDKYGIEFDFIFIDKGELRDSFAEWVIYLDSHLDDSIKIVAADDNSGDDVAGEMKENIDLLGAIDVIGLKYTAVPGENAINIAEKFGKKLWYSAGTTPAFSKDPASEGTREGLTETDGVIDTATQIIHGMSENMLTLYNFDSSIGTNAENNHLITVSEPWDGTYTVNPGVYTAAHFSMFLRNGWRKIESSSKNDGTVSDGKVSGDDNSYITFGDIISGDFSLIISNNSMYKREYTFSVQNLPNSDKLLHMWETTGKIQEADKYYENYFVLTEDFYPEENAFGEGDVTFVDNSDSDSNDNYEETDINETQNDDNMTMAPCSFSITVKPYSITTITSLDRAYDAFDVIAYHYSIE